MHMVRAHILVCGGTGCTSSHSAQIIEALEVQLNRHGLANEIKVIKTGCFGLCERGPIMIVYPEGVFYSRVTADDIPEIVEEHILKGRIVKRLLYQDNTNQDTVQSLNRTKFYEKLERVALRNCGVINPEDIMEYIAVDGYEALGRVLTGMTPQEVVDIIKASGLRGRGGAGFPTGMKWQFAMGDAPVKYVCCN
ncbi:MAG: NAD(P)H-dependent oxidoreductase subunit E, partial [Firmicutes bacterium]|nr:NAD(P)H-dependent oxidoreductase subunit E [Bacillota bacterium]